MQSWSITSFYRFTPVLELDLPTLRSDLQSFFTERNIEGLFLLSTEGANATISGSEESIIAAKSRIEAIPGFIPIEWKDSHSNKRPFRRLTVDIRPEIVTLKRPDLVPHQLSNRHLSPEAWHTVLETEEDFVLLDTRNDYETKLGVFRGATDPKIRLFSEFGGYLDKANIPKEKKVLMYCTGGVRCEKAILEMQSRGYENVFQLQGGILKYLESYPEGHFEGECFVFDHRVAVDAHLQPSKNYSLCPLCGDPGTQRIDCIECGTTAIICTGCEQKALIACSKNCRYHVLLKQEKASHGSTKTIFPRS